MVTPQVGGAAASVANPHASTKAPAAQSSAGRTRSKRRAVIGVVSSTGRDANRIFQVAEGYVRLTGLHEDGSEALITIYVSGNCYAETALVSRRPYNHTSIAMVKSRINILHERDF